jgi:trk system potassium uptake protein TrkH
MRLRLVFAVAGRLLSLWSIAFLAPAVFAVADAGGDFVPAAGYIAGAAASFLTGRLLMTSGAQADRLHRTEAMAVVAGTWILLCAAAAVPFLWAGLSPADAFFESMSGLTTTGATVLVRFDLYDRALFLWRAEIQWIGGLGVIALFVAVLPRLGVAGRQLFFAEATGASEDGIVPQIRRTAGRLWILYTGLTIAQVALLVHYGMPGFDAVCNAMSTLSTGGLSPHPGSIAGYGLPACEWVIIGFMFLGGASFTLQYRALTGRPLALLRDTEFRVYAGIALAATAATALLLADALPTRDDLRLAAFQVVSMLSSTGFASADFNLWSDGARALLMLCMLVGGCAGSSAGGPKVVRWLLLYRHARRELTKELHPRAVIPVRLGRETVSDEVMHSIVMLVVVYVATWGAASLALVLLGADLVTGATASLACLANAGPGLGTVGPMANFAGLPDASKWVLTVTMWIGRLEVVTVIALIRWEVLRGARWRT